MSAALDARGWTAPKVFGWLARTGGVADAEMLRVFNCGIGMALVVEDAVGARALLEAAGETVFDIGRIVAGPAEAEVHISHSGGLFT
jgi:phosphoribosylformylglycinamidine cyclo-ligase